MAVKVAVNGLGRIGRCVAKIIADRDDIELVAVMPLEVSRWLSMG